MKPLFTQLEYDNAKSTDKLPCECYVCGEIFYDLKKHIANALRPYHTRQNKYCSRKCTNVAKQNNVTINCSCCNKTINKTPYQIKKSKSDNHFCSSSCAAKFNNTHKTKGNRRSKLEKYLETKLTYLYPQINILFNDKIAINSELDIYIPSLKLAFELNGIFHYEPIFGDDKLNQIINNDKRKFQACIERGIELCIIDTSQQKYFKESSANRYLTIINNIMIKKFIKLSVNDS